MLWIKRPSQTLSPRSTRDPLADDTASRWSGRSGWWWAWTHDPLAAVNLNRLYRAHLAHKRREERAALRPSSSTTLRWRADTSASPGGKGPKRPVPAEPGPSWRRVR